MAKTKLFLVQFLIEADVSEWPDFDESKAADYFLSALKLSGEDKKHSIQVYLLTRKPNEGGDLLIEEHEDRGYKVEIRQNADTVGTDIPTYFALVTNMQIKNPAGYFAGSDHATEEEAKEAARANIDKRIEREKRRKK